LADGQITLLVIGGYILTIILIIVAYSFKLCNFWLLAFSFFLTWIPVCMQESSSQFMPYLGTALIFLFYTTPMFVTSMILAKIQDREEKNYYMTPEDDSQQDEE